MHTTSSRGQHTKSNANNKSDDIGHRIDHSVALTHANRVHIPHANAQSHPDCNSDRESVDDPDAVNFSDAVIYADAVGFRCDDA